jgi:hypothetical protein
MPTYQYLDGTQADGTILGQSSSAVISFYGKAPVTRRPYSAAVHATSALATSASFGASQLAALQEVQLTLIGLGIYATV